ncbi:MAG: Crp/Fnr family transcriptional regulator [Hyphococcus sp.]
MSATSLVPVEEDRDVAGALTALPIFKDLPEAVVQSISQNSDLRVYEPGHTVFSAGHFDGGEFFAVVSGVMKVSFTDPQTGSMIIEELKEEDIFGLELALCDVLLEDCERFSATAVETLKLVAVDAEQFRSLAGQRPSLMRNIAMFLAGQLSAQRFSAARAGAAPHQRVYAALLHFVERDAMTGQWRIQRMPKHRELADQAGVDETVTADAVASLIQEGVAQRDYPGMIINDMSRLNELAG